MQNGLFKKSSMERISSPEKLNDYIRVSTPSSWMVLTAVLAVLIGLLVWGFAGEIEQTMTFPGRLHEGKVQCFVDAASSYDLDVGMEARLTVPLSREEVGAVTGVITHIAELPLSYDEAAAGIDSAYMQSSMGLTGWNIEVTIETDDPLYENLVYQVTVVTDTQRPIDLVFQ